MASDAYPVSALAALIQRVIDQEAAQGNVLNYSDIARKGMLVSRGNVRSYHLKKLKQILEWPKRQGLALGLGVHVTVVDRAIAEDVGLQIDPGPDDWRTDPAFTAQDRKDIAEFIAYRKSLKNTG